MLDVEANNINIVFVSELMQDVILLVIQVLHGNQIGMRGEELLYFQDVPAFKQQGLCCFVYHY